MFSFALIEKLQWTYRRFKLKYLIPFFILFLYTLIGASIFRQLELEPDEYAREIYRNATKYAYKQVIGRIVEIQCHDEIIRNDTVSKEQHALDAINWFITHLNLTNVIEERTDPSPWSWFGACFYAGTLYTTIGYGRPFTKTSGGQLASIIYIMIGIPIFLIILKEVGQHLSRLLRKVYKKWTKARAIIPTAPIRRCSIALQNKLQISHIKLSSSHEHSDAMHQLTSSSITNDDVVSIVDSQQSLPPQNVPPTLIDQHKSQRKSTQFPITWALLILILWICMSAGLFCTWEHEWGYLTSVYFFFVSISTVGLGDVVPSHPDMMLANFILILIGLALLSMCINLIQTAIEHLLKGLLQQYMEEFEKIAAIVAEEEEEVRPFETGILSTFAAAPFTTTHHDNAGWGAKSWFTEQIASNLLKSRMLGRKEDDDDDDSSSIDDDEKSDDDELVQVVVVGETTDGNDGLHRVQRKVTGVQLHQHSNEAVVMEENKENEKRSSRMNSADVRRRSKMNIPAMRAMQIMAKNNPGGSFKNQLLSKMIANDKFHLIETAIKHKITKMVAVQTEDEYFQLPITNATSATVDDITSRNSLTSYYTALERQLSDDELSTLLFMTPAETFTEFECYRNNAIERVSIRKPPTTLTRFYVCSACGHQSTIGLLRQQISIDSASNGSNDMMQQQRKLSFDYHLKNTSITDSSGNRRFITRRLSSTDNRPSLDNSIDDDNDSRRRVLFRIAGVPLKFDGSTVSQQRRQSIDTDIITLIDDLLTTITDENNINIDNRILTDSAFYDDCCLSSSIHDDQSPKHDGSALLFESAKELVDSIFDSVLI